MQPKMTIKAEEKSVSCDRKEKCCLRSITEEFLIKIFQFKRIYKWQ